MAYGPIREALRLAFQLWGLPEQLRLDNGYPWNGRYELPTPLALWAAGLAVGLHFNRPRHPEENGVVEKSHGTSSDWAEPERCADVEQLQQSLDETDLIQRARYPLAGKKSRMELFPELAKPRRVYRRDEGEAKWDEALAREYLAGQLAARKVDSQGKVAVYARPYYVGTRYKGRTVYVSYDPQEGQWVFADEKGTQLSRQPAEQITRQRLLALDLSAKASHNQAAQ